MPSNPVPEIVHPVGLAATPEPNRADGVAPEPPQPQVGEPQAPQTGFAREPRGDRLRRKAHRTRLHLYAFGAVALLVYAVALAASNTRHVKVDWVFGTASVPLVWLVLFAAILGWVLGILITALFRWRTREPHPS